MNVTDNELVTIMSGGGGSQVDVIFYLINQSKLDDGFDSAM